MSAEFLTAPNLPVRHGFFTRRGGVSAGPYASLNCSLSSGDDPENIARNRYLAAEALGVAPGQLCGVNQVHGILAVTVTQPFLPGSGPRADAMVSAVPGVALGVITADCAPVLLAAPEGIVAAAHAGWRGAAAGILDATIIAMEQLGASRSLISASIGPCIAQASYEVGEDLRSAVLPTLPEAAAFFTPGTRSFHWQFDLAGYCAARLAANGVAAHVLAVDTMADDTRFFSHRRRTLGDGGPIGHQISMIAVPR